MRSGAWTGRLRVTRSPPPPGTERPVPVSKLDPVMSTNTKAPTLQTRDLGSIIINCAAFAVAVCVSGGTWLVLR